MNKDFSNDGLAGASHDEHDIRGLINRIQQRLVSVEKKLDMLIDQSSKRPFEKAHSRRFDRSHRHNRKGPAGGFKERNYNRVICAECGVECEIPFRPSGDRPVYCKECFSEHKNGGHSNKNKRQSKKRQRPANNKTSFFERIKRRK